MKISVFRSLTLVLFVSICSCFDSSLRPASTESIILEMTTDNWAMELEPGTDPLKIAEKHGHIYLGPVGNLEGYHLFKKKNDTTHGVTHPHHHESQEIWWSELQIAKQRYKRGFSDPLYANQWHLRFDSSIGNIHINIEQAWSQGFTGQGVTVAVVDDGLEYSHPDLSANYLPAGSYDFNYNDADPNPDLNSDDHGTAAAGVASARDNNACGVGSAYRANLAGIRLISIGSTDSQEAAALNYQYGINHIYSNSWGPIDDARRKEGPGRMSVAALKNGAEKGRNGKGSIYVWAGGNGLRSNDNCNYDGWANSKYTIAVGAVDYRGVQSWYSEPCSMLVVSAPSSGNSKSITTTDLKGSRGSAGDCTSSFGGTSAAAPLVSGVIALALQANPDLGWRDVQGVLINTAFKTDPSSSSWQTNGAGLHISHNYGFGLVDASAAVTLAKTWKNLGPVASNEISLDVNTFIPDKTWVQSTIRASDDFIVEHIEVYFKAAHPKRGELKIVLVSPSGTVSILAEPHGDTTANYDWTFGSIFCWGEHAKGDWILKVYDNSSGNTGTWNTWALRVYGHAAEDNK